MCDNIAVTSRNSEPEGHTQQLRQLATSIERRKEQTLLTVGVLRSAPLPAPWLFHSCAGGMTGLTHTSAGLPNCIPMPGAGALRL